MARHDPLPFDLPEYFSVSAAVNLGLPRSTFNGHGTERVFHGARSSTPWRSSRPIPPDAGGGQADDASRPVAHEPVRSRHNSDYSRSVAESGGADAEDAHRRLAHAFLPVMGSDCFFIGATAAALWGMPVPTRLLTSLHVGTTFPKTPPRRTGIAGRRMDSKIVSVSEAGGLPVLDRPEAWASLGKHVSVDEAVIAADALLWIPRNPGGFHPEAEAGAQCTAGQLWTALERGQWLGSRTLREALPLARTGSHSPPETLLRLRLIEAGLPEPALNIDLYNEHGWLANADAAYPEYRVCIEYQSAYHRSAGTYQADVDRQFRLRSAGWIAIELTASHVMTAPWEGVRRVRNALRSRGWPGQPS